MTLDIKTLTFMLMVTSVLYAITIAFFAWQANQYKGIKFYMFGAIFAAGGFLVGAGYALMPENNMLRLISTELLICSCYFYYLGIAKFLDFSTSSWLHYFLFSNIFLLAYFNFFDKENIYISGIVPAIYGIIFYGISCYLLWQRRHENFASSIYFMIVSIVIIILLFISRCYFILTNHLQSAIQELPINKLFILILFISGYLRNVGFIMMVSQRLYQDLRAAALQDFLTQVCNRRATQERLNEQFYQFQRYSQPCSIILIDIDHFKTVNDEYGHEKGDKVLQQVASILKTNLRKTDTLGRWGGEEFLVLLPNIHIDQALEVAEKLRHSVANHKIEDLNCTISLGVNKLEKNDNNIDQAVKRADDALYVAKNNGRNRVEILI